jgi:geranylgeranyl diphosphate synthase type II
MLKNSGSYFSLYEKERKKIDEKIKKLLVARKPSSLYSPGSYILESSGKRLRPVLVLFSARAVGRKKTGFYNASAAVELLHNFTLVHDDIMDNADKRRGLATLHKKYDTSTAILVGDSLLSVAYELLLKDVTSNCKSVITDFNKGLVEVCEGQSLDKEFETRPVVKLPEYLIMIRKKTAAMMEMCCSIGAQLGNGSKAEISALTKYGQNLGIAFQIQDDLLDIANEAEFGKFVGGDLVEGKKTYLFLKALEKSTGKDKSLLKGIIKNKGIKKTEIPFYSDMYNRLGVIDDARKEVKKYTKRALSSLKILNNQKDREFFTWLADYLINRNK